MTLFVNNLIALGISLIGTIALLTFLHLCERTFSRFISHRMGWNAVLATGWLGVPIHEISHLLAAKFFGHRIVAWKLFDPDPVTGTLGYVRHSQTKNNLWQNIGNFFIGISPVLAGGLLLVVLFWWMLPNAELTFFWKKTIAMGTELTEPNNAGVWKMLEGLHKLSVNLITSVWENRTPWLPLQLYLGICVASHLAPSVADLKNSLSGVLTVCVLLTGAAGLCAFLGISLVNMLVLLYLAFGLSLTVVFFQGSYAGILGLLGHARKG